VVALSDALSFPASFASLSDAQENATLSAEKSADGASRKVDVAPVFGISDNGSGGDCTDINLDEARTPGSTQQEITKCSYSGVHVKENKKKYV
jgi:hypothetical protein